MVTDFFGNVLRFATDSLVTVETLPKYGRLFAASTSAEALAAAAASTAVTNSTVTATSAAYEITTADGFDRHLGPCRAVGGGDRGDRSRNCPDSFGAGPSLSTRSLGAVAGRNRVHAAAGGGGAKFWYVPAEGYLGADDVGFSVTVAGVKSEEAWVVGVHTRRFAFGLVLVLVLVLGCFGWGCARRCERSVHKLMGFAVDGVDGRCANAQVQFRFKLL